MSTGAAIAAKTNGALDVSDLPSRQSSGRLLKRYPCVDAVDDRLSELRGNGRCERNRKKSSNGFTFLSTKCNSPRYGGGKSQVCLHLRLYELRVGAPPRLAITANPAVAANTFRASEAISALCAASPVRAREPVAVTVPYQVDIIVRGLSVGARD